MRRLKVGSFYLLFWALILAVLHAQSRTAKADAGDKPSQILLKVRFDSPRPPFAGHVQAIGKDGRLLIAPSKNDSPSGAAARDTISEGYYLGLVAGSLLSLDGVPLLRIQVTDVLQGGAVLAQAGRDLDGKIKPGDPILLVRPSQMTTVKMKAIPDLVVIEDEAATAEQDAAPVARSLDNLKAIAKALNKYSDDYKCYPPAFLVGADGKAWHSWRVLLLPFLEQEVLNAHYLFDEPWDGPNNKKLLDPIPAVYSDQPPGKATDHFTRYAAVTGKGMMFAAEGIRFEALGGRAKRTRGIGVKMRQVGDGTSQTLAIGTLPPETQIPWTKPDDIVIGDKPADIIGLGGFGAPYKSKKGDFGLFLRADGSITGVLDTIDPQLFHAMLTIFGRERPDATKVAAVLVPQVATQLNVVPVIILVREGGQFKAHLEWAR